MNDPNYSYWHSASFSNDGTKVVFTDEWGGGLGARCRANDPNKWGADAIFHLKDDKLTPRELLQVAGGAGRHGKLRSAQRFAGSGSRARYRSAGLVSRRHLVGGLHRRSSSDGDCLFRPRPDRSRRCSCWAATGRPTGTTATSTVRKLRAGLTSLNLSPSEIPHAERNRRCQNGASGCAERPEPAEDRMACKVGRGESLPGPTGAFASFAGRPNRIAAEGDPKRGEFAHEQEQRGEVEAHDAITGEERCHGEEPSRRKTAERSGANLETTGSIIRSELGFW